MITSTINTLHFKWEIQLFKLISIFFVLISFSSVGATPDRFRVQCEYLQKPIAFEYNQSLYPTNFGVGLGPRSKSLDIMVSYELNDINFSGDDYLESLQVNFTTYSFNHIGEEKKELHLLTVYKNKNGVVWDTVTLNTQATKILSTSTASTSSSEVLTRLSNCINIGIW